jgi:hypothetical protein
MTFRELAEAIRQLPEEALSQLAVFVEPYDTNRVAFEVQVVVAEEDIHTDSGVIPAGTYFLG